MWHIVCIDIPGEIMEPKRAPRALYILEEGGEWPRWISSPEESSSPFVIRQEEGESPGHFAARVGKELHSVAEHGGVDQVVIACNERSDPSAIAGRRGIGNLVLSDLAKHGCGSLLFTESQRQSGGSRAALSGLAADLSSEWEGAGLAVSVRFGQPSRPPQESVPPGR